jgi:hypothetical protein
MCDVSPPKMGLLPIKMWDEVTKKGLSPPKKIYKRKKWIDPGIG